MKTIKTEITRRLLDSMYQSVCAQKEVLELLIDEYETDDNKQVQKNEEPRELIKGINGLAEFLGCGSTKAQNIMNSGILQEREIAYRTGKRWRFNKVQLTKLLNEEPEILNCTRAA